MRVVFPRSQRYAANGLTQEKTARGCRAVFGKWLKWKALSLELNQPAMARSRLALRSFLDFRPTDCSTT